MKINQTIDIKASQQLAMTPRLQQAINLLQMSSIDLEAFIQQQMEENPLLQKEEDHHDQDSLLIKVQNFDTYFEQTSNTLTLKTHINNQLLTKDMNKEEEFIAEILIDQLDDDGYLRANLNDLSSKYKIKSTAIEKILTTLQDTCDPSGLFARNLKECFALQLKEKKQLTKSFDQFLENLDYLSKDGLEKICHRIKIHPDTARKYIEELKKLNPKPGLAFDTASIEINIPDVIVSFENEEWQVRLNPSTTPPLLLNSAYYQELKEKCRKKEDLTYIKDKKKHGHWLIGAIHQRSINILKVAKALIAHQLDFFNKGIHFLRPLTLKDIATETGLHESTISRISSNKSMQTPFGSISFKFFFSSKVQNKKNQEGCSSKIVMEKIKNYISMEDPNDPLSDEDISILLKQENILAARRTVAKYRTLMKIGTRAERKNIFL